MLRALIAVSLLSLTGCGVNSYMAPGRGAELSLFGDQPTARDVQTDPSVREVLVKKPLAQFPAGLAVARVQAPGYRNYCTGSYGTGRYSVVTTHDVETPKDFERLQRLPMVRSVAPITQLLLPEHLERGVELRNAAASVGADILLLYTFDTQFVKDDFAPPLMVVTLGLFPTKSIKVRTTASAVLLDTRNGFVYGSVEASSNKSTIGNAWTDDAAADSARRRAEREALDGLLGHLEKGWGQIVAANWTRQLLERPHAGSPPTILPPITIGPPQEPQPIFLPPIRMDPLPRQQEIQINPEWLRQWQVKPPAPEGTPYRTRP